METLRASLEPLKNKKLPVTGKLLSNILFVQKRQRDKQASKQHIVADHISQ